MKIQTKLWALAFATTLCGCKEKHKKDDTAHIDHAVPGANQTASVEEGMQRDDQAMASAETVNVKEENNEEVAIADEVIENKTMDTIKNLEEQESLEVQA